MRIATCIALGAALLAGASTAADLVHLQADEGPVENGKTLKMDFRETERDGAVSQVQVTFGSGGSVSSSLFVLKGFCAIAESRKAGFFRTVPTSPAGASPSTYTATFAARRSDLPTPGAAGAGTSGDADDDILSLEDCRLLGRM